MRTDNSLLEAALIGYQHQRELLAAKIAEIQLQLGNAPATASVEKPKKRVMNAAARSRIAQAQRKRWAEFHKTRGVTANKAKKRKMSPEGRERIAEATRKRWAEFRAAKAKAAAKKPAKKAAAGKRSTRKASASAGSESAQAAT